MAIKEKLLKLKESFSRTYESEDNIERETRSEPYTHFTEQTVTLGVKSLVDTFNHGNLVILDDKVDQFIKWYTDNMVKGHYTDIGEYHFPIKMRDFIEKMAVWYELRYPDYEVNRLMPGSSQEEKEVSKIMFLQNPYINDLFDENTDIHCLIGMNFTIQNHL